jgi:hypothetical protein
MENVKITMPHAGHDEHLCYLTGLGFQAENPQDYIKLVRDAKYMCKQCSRVAASPDNLCKPTEL